MGMQPALMSILTASLLLPVMYRRHRRLVAPSGGMATPAVRRGSFCGVLPADTAPRDVSKVLSAAIAKDRTSIDTTWLMVGGWVWSGGSSADMP